MKPWVYVVLVPMAGGDWYELCRCQSLPSALACVSALLDPLAHGPASVRVEVREEVVPCP